MIKAEEKEGLSPFLTVISLVNGMIGGFILILPVIALQIGYLSTMLVIIVTGIFSYYSCHICMVHIGNQTDVDTVLFKHFSKSKKMKALYDICVWSSLLITDCLYFELIVIQWMGLAPPYEYTLANAVLNAALLFGIALLMKYFEFGANLMAYGIISIAAYMVFLTWVVDSEETQSKSVQFKMFGSGLLEFAAGMGQAIAIQAFFIPVLKETRNQKSQKKYVIVAYVIGILAYTYIAFMGSYGIMYRDFMGNSDGQKTIEGYFGVGTWEVSSIEVIYLLHLYSVFPEFLLISKKRLFGILDYSNSPKGRINIHELIYISIAVIACLGLTMLRISIRDIIDFNGAVVGVIFVYFIPTALHIKCLYFGKGKVPITEQTEKKPEEEQNYEVMNEQGVAEQNDKKNENVVENDGEVVHGYSSKERTIIKDREMKTIQKDSAQIEKSSTQTDDTYQCNCSLENYSSSQRTLNLFMVGGMACLGIFIMINGFASLFD